MKSLYKKPWCRGLQKAGITVLALFGVTQGLNAQVSAYSFAQNSGTFTSIASGGTLVTGSDATTATTNDTSGWAVTIPFSFKFNGTDYTSVYVNSNGGATFGTTTSNAAGIISSTAAFSGSVGVMSRDLWGVFITSGVTTSGSNIITNVASFKGIEVGKALNNVNGIPTGATITAFDETAGTITMSAAATSSSSAAVVRYGTGKVLTSTIGTAPNRIFVIEWIGYNDYSTGVTGSNYLNFQLRLAETTNTVSTVYGPQYNVNTTVRTNEIGLRGASNSDFNNRSGGTSSTSVAWNTTTAGTANSSTVSRDNVTFPASGQTFTWTPPTCVVPTAVTVSNVTTAAATIGWTVPYAVPANGYEVYYSTSNVAPTSSTVLNATNSTTSTTTSATINGLASATMYYVWVRSACVGTDRSIWTAASSFTTLCNSTNVPYTLDFESVTTPSLPTCTSVLNAGTGNAWKTASAPTGLGFDTGKALNYSYNSSNAANTWFFTQGINLTAGVSYRIKYKYANSAGTTQYLEKLKVAYGNAATVAGMTNSLAIHETTTGAPALPTGTTISSANPTGGFYTLGNATSNFVDFTPSSTGVYYFGFNAYSVKDMNQIYVDDINIDVTPTCFEPTALTVASSSVTAFGATASWTAPSTAPSNGYEVYYSTSNVAPTSGTVLNSTNSVTSTTVSAPISGLAPATLYYVWVRSVCVGTDRSVWTTSASFTTLATCLVPTALTVASATVTPSGATASWTAPSTAPSNGYEVYYSTSNVAPTSSTVLNSTNSTTSTTTSAPISGLSPSTIYYVWVRSVCIGADRSLWTATAVSFTTLCQPPALISTTPATVCPGNSANISATAAAGATVNWYTDSTGGTPVATGNTYTTPAVSTTTTYYASAIVGSNSSVGPVSPAAQGGTLDTQSPSVPWAVYFTTLSTAKLVSIDVFPLTSGEAGVIKIFSGTSTSGTPIATIPFTTNVSGGATAQTIDINVDLPAGSYNAYPTIPTSGLRRNISGAVYPYTSPIANITGNGYSSSYYMSFYNWKFSTGCESARQPVVVTASSSACLGTSENNKDKNDIKAYPNPFADVLNISDVSNVKSISVVDISGKLVKTFDKPESTLQLRELNSGMYLVILNMKDGSKQTIKAIKK